MAAVPSFRLVFGDSKLTGRGVLSTCVILRLPQPRPECRCVNRSNVAAKDAEGPPHYMPERAGADRFGAFPHPFRPVVGGSFGVLRRETRSAQASSVKARLRQP